jgi:hypothetical protein
MVTFRASQRPDVAHRICMFHKKPISRNTWTRDGGVPMIRKR